MTVDAVRDERETEAELLEAIFRPQRQRKGDEVKRLMGAIPMMGGDFRKWSELLDETLLSVPFSDPTLRRINTVHGYLAVSDAANTLAFNRGLDGCNRYLLQIPVLFAHHKCPATAQTKLTPQFFRDNKNRLWERIRAGQASFAVVNEMRLITKAPTRRLVGRDFVSTVVPFLRTVLAPKTPNQRGGMLPPELMRVIDVMLAFGMKFRTEKVERGEGQGDDDRVVMEPSLDTLGGVLQFTNRPQHCGGQEFQQRDLQRLATAFVHTQVQREAEKRAQQMGMDLSATHTAWKAGASRVQAIQKGRDAANAALAQEEPENVRKQNMKDYWEVTRARKRAAPDLRANKVLIELNHVEGHTNAVRRPVFVRDFFDLVDPVS